MFIFLVVVLVIALIHVTDMLFFGKRIRHHELTYSSEKIPTDLNGYRIALITDTHDVSAEHIDKFCTYLETHPVDIVLLGGDHEASTQRLFSRLQAVNAPDGIWGVEGNHDDFESWMEEMASHGFHTLNDEGVQIRDGFYLAGVTDLWTNKADAATALANAPSDDFLLLLSHNPDVAMFPESKKADLQLSGHTHGGQITFFGLLKPAIYRVSQYGHTFGGGWANQPEGPDVYVSYGTGYDEKWWCPRIFAHPELTIFTLESTQSHK